jgi:hypothetical protein
MSFLLARCWLQAGRTQNTLPLLKKAKRAILLSGTPALNRPTELLTQLQGLLPKAAITKTAFEGRYAKIVDCGRFKKNVSVLLWWLCSGGCQEQLLLQACDLSNLCCSVWLKPTNWMQRVQLALTV